MAHSPISRRLFPGDVADAGALGVVPAHVLGGRRHIPPSEKLNIAGIGGIIPEANKDDRQDDR